MNDILRDFDKKNEFSKLKIPKFATGGICNDAIFPKLDAFSQIDEIVKDIAKKKDNAIAIEFTKHIGELLKKNGVTPKITEYTRNFETDKTFETRYGVSIDELDFSEHDNQFKERIGFLTRKNEKLFDENKELKQRISELDSKNNQLTESILRKETKIHELESKETKSFDEVPDDITIDGYKCKIIKTESGLYISRDEIYGIVDKEKEPLKQKCKELEDRHQSDCIEINRLNTTIDVLIHKVEYLRRFAGLE